MGELSKLRFSMGATLFLLCLLFFAFLVFADLIITYFTTYSYDYWGFLILVPIALLFISLYWLIGPWAVKRSAGVDEDAISRGEGNAYLRETVRKLCDGSGVPMPTLAIVENSEPNAFVFGRTSKSAYLVVHDSLLSDLTREEVESVLAHEVGHLKHKDHLVMTLVSCLPILTYILARGGFEVIRHSRGGGKGKGQAILVILLVAALSYLIYLLSQMLVLFLSRSREYYADSYSAKVTKNPSGLQSALIKLMTGLSLRRDPEEPSGLRAFYAIDPVRAESDARRYRDRMSEFDLNSDGVIDEKELEIAMQKEARSPWRKANDLFSTHPSIYKRVMMLRQIELEMESSKVMGSEAKRKQTPAEKDYWAGPRHMGGGTKSADAAWKD
jgi:heat shock protein HtpX